MADNETSSARSSRAAPLFQPLSSPYLAKLSQPVIRSFLKERQQYLAAVSERRAQPGGDELQPVSLLASVDRDILKNLCMFGDLGADVTVENVTENIL
jgi:hypothetical protein